MAERRPEPRHGTTYNPKIRDPYPTWNFIMSWIWNIALMCICAIGVAATIRIIMWMF